MFYFTKFTLDNSPLLSVEEAIRHYSLKRHLPLDLQSSTSNITEDKYFFGKENNETLNLTRIRPSFEWMLPKLIISFSKGVDAADFKIRYCLLSMIIFVFLLLSIISNIFSAISDAEFNSDIFTLTVVLAIFLILTYIEVQLTKRKINQAINNFDKG